MIVPDITNNLAKGAKKKLFKDNFATLGGPCSQNFGFLTAPKNPENRLFPRISAIDDVWGVRTRFNS